jgi:hypothetical protein
MDYSCLAGVLNNILTHFSPLFSFHVNIVHRSFAVSGILMLQALQSSF